MAENKNPNEPDELFLSFGQSRPVIIAGLLFSQWGLLAVIVIGIGVALSSIGLNIILSFLLGLVASAYLYPRLAEINEIQPKYFFVDMINKIYLKIQKCQFVIGKRK